jgi:hypothetical protein
VNKPFALLFVGIYLITMMGFSVNYHFCGGKLKNVSVFDDGHVGCCSEIDPLEKKSDCQPIKNSKLAEEKNCCKKKKAISGCCKKKETTSNNHSKKKCTDEKEGKGCCENKKISFRIYVNQQYSTSQIIPKDNLSYSCILPVFYLKTARNNPIFQPVFLGYVDDPPEPKTISLFLVNRSILI